MKIRTAHYVLKQGAINTYRNKLMTLASVSTVSASLLIFGIFLFIIINLNYNMKTLTSQPEMEIFLRAEIEDVEAVRVEDVIKKDPNIKSYIKVTKEEALAKAKKIMGDKAELLEGEDSGFLPISYIVKLSDPMKSDTIAREYKTFPEVDDVAYYMEVINMISKLNGWIRAIALIILIILLAVSTFIISNTIKLTVFARRKEINIMKYIGATDWFIRWPFVVEGIIIGLFGAIIAFVLVSYGYNSIQIRINEDFLSVGSTMLKILSINEFGLNVLGIYAIVGVLVGISGSTVSIRKYLKV